MAPKMMRKAAKKQERKYYRNLSSAYVANYANTLLRQIKERLGRVVSFTREDLLHLPIPEFAQVATITRYRTTCIAVNYLIEHGELVQKKFPDLCLPENAVNYHDETTVAAEYDSTIRRLISGMPSAKPFVVMHVVSRWRTDPQLTSDTKRKAVRVSIPHLVKEGVCRRLTSFEYVVGPANDAR